MYKGERAIDDRTLKVGTPDYKSNNKMSNDFPGLVIDQGVTYTYSKNIAVSLDNGTEKDNKSIQDFRKANSIHDLNLKTGLYSSTCGTTGRLCYYDKEGNARVMMSKPWETIYIKNTTTDEVEYAMIYYKIKIIEVGKQPKDVYRVEWYDKNMVYFYIENSVDATYREDTDHPPQEHGFQYVPVVEFPNNDLRQGDYFKVQELMDGYDRLISDAQNELEDNRNSYMKFKGVVPTEKIMAAAKLTGAFGSEDDEFDVSWLLKDLDAPFYENQKNTIRENIFNFTKRVDMSDEKFSGSAQSGEGRKWKLLALENDASMKETKFRSSLREMYKVLFSGKGINIDYLDLTFQFTRNLPVDLAYYGDILTKYFGKVPLKVLYSLLPFIDDPEGTIKMLLEEQGTVGNILLEPEEDEEE